MITLVQVRSHGMAEVANGGHVTVRIAVGVAVLDSADPVNDRNGRTDGAQSRPDSSLRERSAGERGVSLGGAYVGERRAQTQNSGSPVRSCHSLWSLLVLSKKMTPLDGKMVK